MEMEIELTNRILDKYGLFWDDLLVIGQNKSTWGELLLSLLIARSMLKASELLNISNRTLERHIPKILSNIYNTDKSNSTPWKFIILEDIDIRQCPRCFNYRSSSKDFHSNGKSRQKGICKYCESASITESDRVLLRQKYKKYYENNHGKELNRLKEVKLRRLMRVPVWSETKEIESFYDNCPEGFHVDHIIPLQGKEVSGLHVLNNLQYLSKEDNWKKGNRYNGGVA